MRSAPGRSGNFATGTHTTTQDGLPQLPKGISAPSAAKWADLMDQLPQHVLRMADQHQLRTSSELLALSDALSATVATDPADHNAARLLQTAQQVHRLRACFGLTPADRAKLHLPDDEGPDRLQLWLADAMTHATLGSRPHRTACGADVGHTGLHIVRPAACQRGGGRYSPFARSLSRRDRVVSHGFLR
jgi:hypothetical protein